MKLNVIQLDALIETLAALGDDVLGWIAPHVDPDTIQGIFDDALDEYADLMGETHPVEDEDPEEDPEDGDQMPVPAGCVPHGPILGSVH